MADISIGGLLSWIDGRKRIAADAARGLLSDPVGEAGIWGNAAVESLKDINNNMMTNLSRSRSVIPELREEGRNQVMGSLLNMPGMAGVMTYHGSPNLFDKFDATKAGKSGGTSFGLGHNLSADKGHASAYKGDNGNLYKVDLADESLPKFLRWESTAPKQLTAELPPIDKGKPIQFGGGATLEKSKNGWLLKTGDAAFPLRDSEFNRMFGDANTGEQVYRKLVASLGSEDAASAWLRARGVPGIVNNTERGATNYAVFPGNEHLLKILGRE